MMPACGRRAATRRAAGCTPMPAANARTVISPAYPADRVRALVTSSGSTTMASETEPKTNGAGSATPSQNSLVRSAAGGQRLAGRHPAVPDRAAGRRGQPDGERRRAERQVREVRHDQGIARPLSEERGDDGTEPESGAQRERGAARAERVAAGQVLDPGGRRAEHHAGAQPRQGPPRRDQRQAVRAERRAAAWPPATARRTAARTPGGRTGRTADRRPAARESAWPRRWRTARRSRPRSGRARAGRRSASGRTGWRPSPRRTSRARPAPRRRESCVS